MQQLQSKKVISIISPNTLSSSDVKSIDMVSIPKSINVVSIWYQYHHDKTIVIVISV